MTNKIKPNLILGAGLLLSSAAYLAGHYTSITHGLLFALFALALGLEIWGVILFAQSPIMRNSKLRQWKLRLIVKEGD